MYILSIIFSSIRKTIILSSLGIVCLMMTQGMVILKLLPISGKIAVALEHPPLHKIYNSK